MNVPETSTQEATPTIDEIAHDQLTELTSQSWNLELLISGAALFATLSLPDLLDSALIYYRYLLFSAFLIHFVLRAFWVGLVGMLAVYPEGINDEKVHYLSEYARKRFAREMGSLPSYIIRLDRRYNAIFAVARSPEFLFTQRADNDQRGLTTVLLTDNLKPGRNLLRVTVPDTSSKPQPYCQIPFWYVPEK